MLTESSVLPLSAFIICKDEAGYIENCVRSLDVCSEIVVVDSGSTDGTLGILERLGEEGLPVRVFSRGWPGYAAQKQFALEQCTQPWCMNVDADERLDEDLRDILPWLLKAPANVVGWRVRRRPYLIGYGYSPRHVFERPNLRMIRRGAGGYDLSQRVHEGIRVSGGVKDAPRGSLLHYRALPIGEQILKENSYSTLKAEQISEAGGGRLRWKLLFSPPYYFLRLYFGRRLFLCGWPGFIQAMTGAVYSFLTEAKLFQKHAMREHPPRDDSQDARAKRSNMSKAAE